MGVSLDSSRVFAEHPAEVLWSVHNAGLLTIYFHYLFHHRTNGFEETRLEPTSGANRSHPKDQGLPLHPQRMSPIA